MLEAIGAMSGARPEEMASTDTTRYECCLLAELPLHEQRKLFQSAQREEEAWQRRSSYSTLKRAREEEEGEEEEEEEEEEEDEERSRILAKHLFPPGGHAYLASRRAIIIAGARTWIIIMERERERGKER